MSARRATRAPTPTRAPRPAIDAAAAQQEVYAPDVALRAAQDRLYPAIWPVAMSLSDDDPDAAQDLLQEAWIRLWELDPSRFDDPDQCYLKKALVHRMMDALDHERREGRPDQMVRADFQLW